MKNRVTKMLGIEKPVMLGAMIYLCDPVLAAAISNAGGLGQIGVCANVDAPEPDPIINGENTRRAIQDFRKLSDKPFAVNYIPTTKELARYTSDDENVSFSDVIKKVVIEEKVPAVVITSTQGKNDVLKQDIEDFHKAGIKVLFRELNCTVQACLDGVEMGADIIIVTGAEAGGHSPKYNMSLSTILPMVIDAIPDVPIVAAGSIVNEKSAAAACAMGAEGAYCGTIFQVAKECRAHANYKQAILDAKGEDVIRWRSGTSDTLMATIPNRQARTCAYMAAAGAPGADIAPHYNSLFDLSMIKGDVENGVVSVSASVGAINEIKSAKEIVDDIARGFGA